jgi:hypothetical protein
METTVLDDFPAWSIYIIAFVIVAGFLISLAVLIRSLRATNHRPNAPRGLPRFSRPSFFFLIGAALALWFMGTSMFDRFHAMAIASDRIELVYFWPRPQQVIQRSDLIEVKIDRAYRTCAVLVLTRNKLFRSVNSKKCTVAQEILEKLSQHASIKMGSG